MNNKKFINLTPHEIRLVAADNTTILRVPSSGIARVTQEETIEHIENSIPFVKVQYTGIEGLPEKPEENTLYIVSKIVADAIKEIPELAKKWNGKLVIPNTGPTELGAVRDEKGRIIGVRSLIIP